MGLRDFHPPFFLPGLPSAVVESVGVAGGAADKGRPDTGRSGTYLKRLGRSSGQTVCASS